MHVLFHPFARVFNGYLPTVFVTDLAILKEILVKHFSTFTNREVNIVGLSVGRGRCMYVYCVCEDKL